VQKPKSSLFDDDDEDDLFKESSKKSETTTAPIVPELPEIKEETETKQPSKPKSKNLLFDPLALKSSGLFNKLSENTHKDKSDDESPLAENTRKESLDNSKNKPSIVKENPKEETPAKKLTLFDDAEDDDLFSLVKNLPKKEIPNPKKESLFEETKVEKPSEKKGDELKGTSIFKEEKETKVENIPKVEIKNIIAKKSLFDNTSDEEEEDNLFSSKKQAAKDTNKVEIKATIPNKITTEKVLPNPISHPPKTAQLGKS
jgi:hypothetical protein